MQYNGGKNYTIKRHGMGDFWRDYLAAHPVKRFVDVCCGSGAVASFVASIRPNIKIVCNDIHPAAVAVLRGAAREGWDPPLTLTEEEYGVLRDASRRGEVSPLIGFAGFGVSFGGKFFGGYSRPRPAQSNPPGAAAFALRKDAKNLAHADFFNLDYADLPDAVGVLPGDVWYIDPPYAGTTGYAGTPKFDHAKFWRWATALAQVVPVLVSEFAAPSDWSPVWSVTRKLESRGGERVDCVFALNAEEWDAHLEREEAA